MRNAFLNVLMKRAEEDETIVLLTGDLGFGLLEQFQNRFPDRYVNVGISEQNMMSVAAGMALSGRKVFCYSIGNFPTMRCLEQIRNDVAYHNCDVNIICVGSGFSYGALGMSHQATEDIAVMRALPGMEVLCPADPVEAELIANHCCDGSGSTYVRLNKRGEKTLDATLRTWEFGKAIVRKKGTGQVSLMCTGAISEEVIKATEMLEGSGISVSVLTFPSIKPLDELAIISAANDSKVIVVVEEHSVIGGLGSAVSEVIAESGIGVPLLRIGINDVYPKVVGDQAYLRKLFGMDAESIAKKCKAALDASTKE